MRSFRSILALAASSASGQVFQDDFNAENSGGGALNYFGFAKWTVTGGSVGSLSDGYAANESTDLDAAC